MRTKGQIDRRSFLRGSIAFTCGLSAAAVVPPYRFAIAAVSPENEVNVIGPRAGYSPQIGTLVSMLNWMRGPVLSSVRGLTVSQLDYLHDAKANSIGALLLHLAAKERFYQVHTFEEKKWGNLDAETAKRWSVPSGLGAAARKTIKGNELGYYLHALKEVRDQTLLELQKRDDAWLMKVDPAWFWGPTNNYCKWFHVCEHESNHNGQIKWIKGRLPGQARSQD